MFAVKPIAFFISFTLVFNTTLLPVVQARASQQAVQIARVGVGEATDTDEDGIPDLDEGRQGLNPNNKDTDFDQLEDLWELDHGLDALNPDINGDGLLDYQEIALDGVLDTNRDSDGDGSSNLQDQDNDNDGVIDGLDISPYAKTNSAERFSLHLTTQGKPTYFNITLRPADASHLNLPGQAWNWPYDDQGQMQDLDYSKEDLVLYPALEFSTDDLDIVLKGGEVEDYGISVSGDAAHVPLTEVKHEGKNVALSGKLFIPASEGPLDMTIEARLVWLVKATTDKTDLQWTPLSGGGIGHEHQGGGVDYADLNGNGKPEIIMMAIDAPQGANNIRYRIGWDMDGFGRPTAGWGDVRHYSPHDFMHDTDGGGLAVGDIDGNGRPDMLVMAIQDNAGNNEFVYLIGWDLDASGVPASWSDTIELGGIGSVTDGGGAKLHDFDGNGVLELLLMGVNDPDGSNDLRYRIGWNLGADAKAASWSAVKLVPTGAIGHDHAGGGAAIGDLDGNGQPELVLMAVDAPEGANPLRYLVGWNLDAQGNAASWSNVASAEALGDLTDGGGATLVDFNHNGRPDLLFMVVDDPKGENEFRYRIGWDLNAQGQVSNSWSAWIAPPDSQDLGHSNQGGGAVMGDIDQNGVPDVMLLAIDNPDGANAFRYRIGWNLDASGQPQSWSAFSAPMQSANPSHANSGAGLALSDIDGNGVLDAVFLGLDKGDGMDDFRYQVGWNLETDGRIAQWSAEVAVAGTGELNEGAGAAMADLNGNGVPDLLLMAVDAPNGANNFRYRIGWDLGSDGLASGGWSDTMQIAPMDMAQSHAGAGAEFADLNGNGLPDLLLSAIKSQPGTNDFSYLVAWDMDASGQPQSVTQLATADGIGDSTSGGGLALGDLDGDGKADLLLAGVDNPDGADEFRYRVLHQVGSSHWGFPNHTTDSLLIGDAQSDGGLAVADINGDGSQDMVTFVIDDQSGADGLKYRIGWTLNPDGRPANWGGWHSAPGMGDYTEGAGVEVGRINDNDIPDLILMAIDNPAGPNHFRYRIGWDMDAGGIPASWSNWVEATVALSDTTKGGGLALGQVDDDARPDLVFLAARDAEQDRCDYTVALNLDHQGLSASWLPLRDAPSMGDRIEGADVALANLNHRDGPELLVLSIDDPDGANSFRYQIGWDMRADGTVDHWSRSVETAQALLHRSTDGAGATIADVTGDGKLDLVLMALDDLTSWSRFSAWGRLEKTDAPNLMRLTVGQNIESGSTILARYADDAYLTGFSLQENHGTEVGVFHDSGDHDGTPRGYVYLYYEYLNSSKALADTYAGMHEDPYNLSMTGNIKGFAHQEEALLQSSEMIRDVLDAFPNDEFMPIVFAMTDRSAELNMDGLTTGGGVLLSGSSLDLDVAAEEMVVSHSLKMPWYDATALPGSGEQLFLPLGIDKVVEHMQTWGYTDEEEQQTAQHLVLWDEGEMRISRVADKDVFVAPDDNETSEALNWVSRGLLSVAGLVTLPSRAKGLGMFYRAWHSLGRTLAQSAKAGQAMYRMVSGSRSTNVKLIQNVTGKPVSRNLAGKFSKLGRLSTGLKVVGAVVVVAALGYTAYTIIKQEGVRSDFGWALSGLTVALNTFYLGMIVAIGTIPLVGTALAGLIVLSDFIVGYVTGTSWSERAIAAIVNGMVDRHSLSGVDLVAEESWTEVDDTANNGLTAGDEFTYAARMRAVAYELNEGDEDLDSTYIRPSFRFSNGSGYTQTASKNKYQVLNFGDERWDMWELKANLVPTEAAVNLQANLHFEASYEVHYKECVDWEVAESCDYEASTGTQTSDSPLYLDVLSDTVDGFISWSAISPQNQNPWSEGDSYEMRSGTTLNVSAALGVLANDYDPGLLHKDLDVRVTSVPTKGDLTLDAETGAFTYRVKASEEPFYGEDSFRYVAVDLYGSESQETLVTITVLRTSNQKPMAGADEFHINQDEEATLDVLANDQDGDGDALEIRAVSQPEHGEVFIEAATIRYAPEEGWYGELTFKYVLGDTEEAAAADGEVHLVIHSSEHPYARGDSYGTDEDQALVVAAPGVLNNDTDPQSDPMHVSSHTNPTHGVLALNANGSFSYTPSRDYHGEDSFTYVANDGAHDSQEVRVTLNVAPVNDAPYVLEDSYTFYGPSFYARDAGTGVLGNDRDAEGNSFTALLVTAPAVGVLVLRPDGSFSYEASQRGQFSFTYKASDGLKESAPVIVKLNVADDHDRPLGVHDRYTLGYGDSISSPSPGVLDNDLGGWELVDIFPQGEQGALTGVNDKGQVVGYVQTANGSEGIYIPRLDPSDPDVVQRFSYPGASDTIPHDLNDAGMTIGEQTTAGITTGFSALTSGWTFSGLSRPGSDRTRTFGLDANGLHVGDFDQAGVTTGYRYDGSQYLDFGLAGASAVSVNDVGQPGHRVGSHVDADGWHGFYQSGDADPAITLDVPWGSDTQWRGLSTREVLAGHYLDIHGVQYSIVSAADEEGQFRFSRSHIHNWPQRLQQAEGVNDDGWVVGRYENPWGNYGFLIIPRPYKSSVSLVQGPVQGTLTLNTDGSFDYHLNDACYVGQDSFRYALDDGRSEPSAPVTVLLDIPYRDNDGDTTPDCSDTDDDNDTIPDALPDNCPTVANTLQTDTDQDGVGDVCDNCPAFPDPSQPDTDGDGTGDQCDPCTDANQDGQCDFDYNCIDPDADHICAQHDNCPLTHNPGQEDDDGNGVGNVCDWGTDLDGDGVWDQVDNCPAIANPDQADDDQDGIGNPCDDCVDQDQDQVCDQLDNCPFAYNPDQADTDGDGLADACDLCLDVDADGICDQQDVCPGVADPDQLDLDGDGLGDYCDPCTDVNQDGLCDFDAQCVDSDLDGVCGPSDNCPTVANPGQEDEDGDGLGDACDTCLDADQDGLCSELDNCPIVANPDQADADGDGLGDLCDAWTDQDQDAVPDNQDVCPTVYDPQQLDADGDGLGDACDTCQDQDHDGICAHLDNCPLNANTGQEDQDADGQGDVCDQCQDQDQDGLCDQDDNCPTVANPDQADADLDDVGNACDTKSDPTINWNNPADIIYGTALSEIQLNATATFGGLPLAGTFTYLPAAGVVLPAGTHVLSADFVPEDTNNYNPVLGTTVNLRVGQADPPSTYTLTYLAGVNGSIIGATPQTVGYGASGTAVTVVPKNGYRFVQWSDGSTANPRTDSNVTADITVTASFAKKFRWMFFLRALTAESNQRGEVETESAPQ